MSNNPYDEEDEEESEEAFVDLDDPHTHIIDLDDPNSQLPVPDDVDDDDNDVEKESTGTGIPPVIKVPTREDSCFMFRGRGKPIHCVDCHPTLPMFFACAGEDDVIYVLLHSVNGATRLKVGNDPEGEEISSKIQLEAEKSHDNSEKKEEEKKASLEDEEEAKKKADDGAQKEREEAKKEFLAEEADENNMNLQHQKQKSSASSSSSPLHFSSAIVLRGHTDTITQLQFSPNGAMLASGGMDGQVLLWGISDGMKQQQSTTSATSSSPSDQTTAISTTTTVSDIVFRLLFTLTDLTADVESLIWHPSSLLLVGGSSDTQIAMWNTSKGNLSQYLVGHQATVNNLLWANENKKLLSTGSDGSILVFNPKTGESEMSTNSKDLMTATQLQELANLPPGSHGIPLSISVVAFLPSSSSTLLAASGSAAMVTASSSTLTSDILCIGCEDGTLHLLSLSKGKMVYHFPAQDCHEQCVECISISDAFPFFASCSCDGKIQVWNSTDYSLRESIKCSEGFTKIVWVQMYVIGASTDGDVRIWDARQPNELGIVHQFMGHAQLLLDVKLLAFQVPIPPEGDEKDEPSSVKVKGNVSIGLITSSDDGSVRVFQTKL